MPPAARQVKIQIPIMESPGAARRLQLPTPGPEDNLLPVISLNLPLNPAPAGNNPEEHEAEPESPAESADITPQSSADSNIAESASAITNTAPRARDISSSLNKGNILPKGMGRKRVRKAAHTAQL